MELGWIPMVKTVEEKVKALLSFFQVSTERAWEDYYLNQQLKVAFRISLNNTKEPHAISAWLRQGEVQAAETEVCEFSEKALREAIPAMKSLCAEHPAEFCRGIAGTVCQGGRQAGLYTLSAQGSHQRLHKMDQ